MSSLARAGERCDSRVCLSPSGGGHHTSRLRFFAVTVAVILLVLVTAWRSEVAHADESATDVPAAEQAERQERVSELARRLMDEAHEGDVAEVSQADATKMLFEHAIEVMKTSEEPSDKKDPFATAEDASAAAETFGAVAHEMGLESHVVKNSAGEHAWNIVQVDDAWYHVDVWTAAKDEALRAAAEDDSDVQDDELVNRWLLAGSDEIGTYDESHKDWSIADEGVDQDTVKVSPKAYVWPEGDAGRSEGDESSLEAMAETSGTCGDNLQWNYANGKLTITGTGEMTSRPWSSFARQITSVSLPEGMTSICDCAFEYCTQLASVTLPEGIISIGGGAFEDCYKLSSIELPNSLTSIGGDAFYNCEVLSSISLPDGLTFIGDEAFGRCFGLVSISIPKGITSIRKETFVNCYSLSSVSFSNGVTSIGERAFLCCESLKTISLPEGVCSIASEAFYKCTSLSDISLPSTLASIGSSAFYGCTNLSSIALPDGLTAIESDAFFRCKALKAIKIPNGLTTIGVGAFCQCENLSTVSLPNSITTISGSIFESCPNLIAIDIPEGVTTIGNYAFNGCSSLASVTIPEGVTTIGNYAFNGCSSLASVTIPEGVTTIGNYAFQCCSSLPAVTIPEGVTTIGGGVFKGCSSLTSVSIHKGVTEIGTAFFEDCAALTFVSIPEGVTWIGDSAFRDCSALASVTIPESVTSIDRHAFQNCTSLASFSIPEGVSDIESDVFNGCSALASVSIPEGVTTIGGNAFESCSSLSAVSIPEGLTKIGYSAFEGCTSLALLALPKSLTVIDGAAFKKCSQLTDVYYEGDEEQWTAIDIESYGNDPLINATIHYNQTSLPMPWSTCGTCEWNIIDNELVVRPVDGADVGTLEDWGTGHPPWYLKCQNVKTVRFEGTVKAPSCCRMFASFTSLTAPDLSGLDTSETTDMSYMFTNCPKIISFDLAGLNTSKVTTMKEMFSGCSSVPSIDLSTFDTAKVKNMDKMFDGCTSVVQWKTGKKYKIVSSGGVPSSSAADGKWWSKTAKQRFSFKEILDGRSGLADTYVTGDAEREVNLYTSKPDVSTSGLWSDEWLTEDSTKYKHKLATTACILASGVYNYGNAKKSLDALGFDGTSYDSYYPYPIADYKGDIDQVGYFFAKKTSAFDGSTIVAVLVRGTVGNTEWASNFNMADTKYPNDYHEAFQKAEETLKKHLESWLKEKGIDASRAKFLVVGHSRGAAVANILGYDIDRGALSNPSKGEAAKAANTYVYTFATPNVTSLFSQSWLYEYACNNVYNIVSAEDTIPRVPLPEWGFGKFGKTMVLPSISNTGFWRYNTLLAGMRETYSEIYGERFQPYKSGAIASRLFEKAFYGIAPSVEEYYKENKVGMSPSRVMHALGRYMNGEDEPKDTEIVSLLPGIAVSHPFFTYALLNSVSALKLSIVNGRIDKVATIAWAGFDIGKEFWYAHTSESYVAWMKAMEESDFADTYRGVKIACPVNVKVYHEDGTCVCSIVDDVVDESLLENGLAADVVDGVKYIDMPSDEHYRIEITATDDGSMDVSYEEMLADGTSTGSASFAEVSLTKGKVYGLEVEDTGVGSDADDRVEMLDPQGDRVEPTYTASGDTLRSVNVNPFVSSGDGSVEGAALVDYGEPIAVTAVPAEGSVFLGWYEGDKLVSTEARYSFCAVKDRELGARFGFSLESATVSAIANQTYTGKALKPAVTVKLGSTTLKAGTDYTLAYGSNTKVGTANVTITGKGNYTGTLKTTFKIVAANLSKATVDAIADQTYTGSALKPEVTVKMGSTTLKSGTDYTLKYASNTNVGTATITITGKGNYTGTKKVTFNIVESAPENPFIDVTENTSHYADILWLASTGISGGWNTPAGKEFRPNANVARGDMAAFLFRLAKRWNLVDENWKPKGTYNFVDVTDKTSHRIEILWMAESGISTGWSTAKGAEFRPNDPVKRGQMAAFMQRMAVKVAGRKGGASSPENFFRDVTGSTSFHDEIWWLAGNGVTQGWGSGAAREYRPNANVARGDMAAFLHRLDSVK